MSTRHKHPKPRRHEVIEFNHAGFCYVTALSRYPDSTSDEFFLDLSAKPDTVIAAAAQYSAAVPSLATQFGVPLETIRHATLRDRREVP